MVARVYYTVSEAQRWAAERRQELERDRLETDCSITQRLNRIDAEVSRLLWETGAWLGEMLRAHGASKQQVASICMALGQRSFGRDAAMVWAVAVSYANEFAATGDTREKGGLALAETVHKELFG